MTSEVSELLGKDIPEAYFQLPQKGFKTGKGQVLFPAFKALKAGVADPCLSGELSKSRLTPSGAEVGCELVFEGYPWHKPRMLNPLNHMWFFGLPLYDRRIRWGI